MIKQVVTTACFALGGAGAVLVGFLANDPRAFTHPVASLPLESAIHSHLEDAPVVIEQVGEAPQPESVTLGASRPTHRGAMTADLAPCSAYRDIGAMFIEPSGATGVRSVRHLCANDAVGGRR